MRNPPESSSSSTRTDSPALWRSLRHNPLMGSGSDAESPQERAQNAFEHAVNHERDAIVAHEAAAARHEEIAAQQEQAALSAPDDLRDQMTQLAARERSRAGVARDRAETVRKRLRAEGIDPDPGR